MTDTNGSTTHDELRAARRKSKLLREQIELKQLQVQEKIQTKLLESWGMWNGWDGFGGSDLWDRFRPKTNSGERGWMIPPNVPTDRAHGAYWPFWRNQWELDALRQQSRVRAESNAFGIGLLDNLTNNVVGKGFTYKVLPKIGVIPTGKKREPQPDELAEVQRVQDYVDAWCKRNRWNGTTDPQALAICGSREREIYQTIKKDGECFVRFHPTDAGLEVSFVNTEQVRDGHGGTRQEGWFVGIRHQMEPYENVEKPEEYAVYWPDPSATGGKEGEPQEGNFAFIDASEILHLKGVNTPANVARGLPLFIFDCGNALDRAAKLQMFASIGATVQASNAEVWQFANQTQAQVESMASALAARINAPKQGEPAYTEQRMPGLVRRIPEGMELVENAYNHSDAYMTAKRGDLEQAASAACAPLFWLGPLEEGNYSNLESSAAPAVRAGITEQEYMKTACAAVVWRALLYAEENGDLPAGITKRIDLKVDAPAVLHRNELEKAQEDQIGVTTGWKDRQTCAAERGLDFDQIEQNNTEYTKTQQELMPQPMPGQGGEGGKEEGSGGGLNLPKAPMPKAPMPRIKESAEHDVAGEKRDKSGQWTNGGDRKAAKAKNRDLRKHVEDGADSPSFSFGNMHSDPVAREKLVGLAYDADRALANPNISSEEKAKHYDATALHARKVEARYKNLLAGVDMNKVAANSREADWSNIVGALRRGAKDAEARAAAIRNYGKQGKIHESAEARIARLQESYGAEVTERIVAAARKLVEDVP